VATYINMSKVTQQVIGSATQRMDHLLRILDRPHTTDELHAAARAVRTEVTMMMQTLMMAPLPSEEEHRKPLPSDSELPLE